MPNSWTDEVARYYAARAPDYDVTAGYTDTAAEKLREPIKARYSALFEGRDVLEIACGTGYWTAVVGATAKSVLAIDINESVIAAARSRCSHMPNITFQVDDAYLLRGVRRTFNAAFAHWWWSHIPKSRIRDFITTLHRRLEPGALVIFADQLPYDCPDRRLDSEGNSLETRTLPDGRKFEIVKNFPSANELTDILRDFADDLRYIERPDEGNWELTCFSR